MGAVGHMMFPNIDQLYFSVLFTMLLMVFMIYLPYQKITSILKYACLSLLVYCIVPLYHDDIAIMDIIKASCIRLFNIQKIF